MVSSRIAALGRRLGRPLAVVRRQKSILLLPAMLCGIYYYFIAADQYQSEAHFVIRSAGKPDLSAGLSFLVQLGLMKSDDDSSVVQDYMTSRDALKALSAKLPIAEIYSRKGADFLARYPSILYNSSEEQFYKYYRQMVTVLNVERTGISTLRVDAFHPDDAQRIADTLLILGEDLVNRMNQRILKDAIASSRTEVESAEARVIGAQTALTEFRNRELVVDPQRSAAALAEIIGRLSAELSSVQTQIAQVKSTSATNPQLGGLQTTAAALERQITKERAKIAEDKGGGLAARVAQYERLVLEREFANRTLNTAAADLIRARVEAERKLLYLERIVEPNLPDYADLPLRLRRVLTALVINLLLIALIWLISTGVREHVSHGH